MTSSFLIHMTMWFMMINISMMMLTLIIHPVHMIMLIIMYNILLCMNMSMQKTSYMYSLIFFMIMISGLLITFLYFSSLVANEKILTNKNKIMPPMLMLNTLFISLIIASHDPLLISYNNSFDHMNYFQMNKFNNNMLFSMFTMYTHPLKNLSLISMMYLLTTMISIIKICSYKNKSLRKLM